MAFLSKREPTRPAIEQTAAIPPRGLAMSQEMHAALDAASLGGEHVRSLYGVASDVSEKDRGDLVSAADLASEDSIVQHLQSAFPGWDILTEERGLLGSGHSRHRWIIDPLDASSAFIVMAGRQYPSILIALEENGELKLGVCYFPLTGEWFFAERGKGAFKGGIQLPLVPAPESLQDCWIQMNHYGDYNRQTDFFTMLDKGLRGPEGARLVTREVPFSGAAMRLLDGSQGVGAVVHDNSSAKPKQMPGDTAAIQVILEEAGGVMLTPSGQRYETGVPTPIIASLSAGVARQIAAVSVREMTGCDVRSTGLLKVFAKFTATGATWHDVLLCSNDMWEAVHALAPANPPYLAEMLEFVKEAECVKACLYQMDVAERCNGDYGYYMPFLKRAFSKVVSLATRIEATARR